MLVCQRNTTVYVQSPPESRVCSGSEDRAAAHHDTRSDPRGPCAPRCPAVLAALWWTRYCLPFNRILSLAHRPSGRDHTNLTRC